MPKARGCSWLHQANPAWSARCGFRELLPGCHDHAPHSISGAKLQHENDLPLARVTTAVGCQRAICPETTTARNPSTSARGWGFLRDARSREGLRSRAVGRQAFPGGPIARVQSHKAATGSAEKISAVTSKIPKASVPRSKRLCRPEARCFRARFDPLSGIRRRRAGAVR